MRGALLDEARGVGASRQAGGVGRLEGEAAVEEAPEDEVLPVGQDMETEAYPQHPQPPRPAEALVGQHTEQHVQQHKGPGV